MKINNLNQFFTKDFQNKFHKLSINIAGRCDLAF